MEDDDLEDSDDEDEDDGQKQVGTEFSVIRALASSNAAEALEDLLDIDAAAFPRGDALSRALLNPKSSIISDGQDTDGADEAVEDPGTSSLPATKFIYGKQWGLKRYGSGRYYESPDGSSREYFAFARPQPSPLKDAETVLAGAKRFVLAAANGRIDLGTTTSGVAWQQGAARDGVKRWLHGGYFQLTPFFEQLLNDIGSGKSDVWEASYFEAKAGQSLSPPFAATQPPSAAGSASKYGVSGRFGFRSNRWATIYCGQAQDPVARHYSHEATLLRTELSGGRGRASYHYQQEIDNDAHAAFLLGQVTGLADLNESAECLAVWEELICVLMGGYCLDEQYLKSRARFGQWQISTVKGINGTRCMEGPRDHNKQQGEEPGIADPQYKFLLHLYRAAVMNLTAAHCHAHATHTPTLAANADLPSASSAAHAHAHADARAASSTTAAYTAVPSPARTKPSAGQAVTRAAATYDAVRSAEHARANEITLTGKMLYRWPLNNEATHNVSIFGKRLRRCEVRELQRLARNGGSKGSSALFCVLYETTFRK